MLLGRRGRSNEAMPASASAPRAQVAISRGTLRIRLNEMKKKGSRGTGSVGPLMVHQDEESLTVRAVLGRVIELLGGCARL